MTSAAAVEVRGLSAALATAWALEDDTATEQLIRDLPPLRAALADAAATLQALASLYPVVAESLNDDQAPAVTAACLDVPIETARQAVLWLRCWLDGLHYHPLAERVAHLATAVAWLAGFCQEEPDHWQQFLLCLALERAA